MNILPLSQTSSALHSAPLITREISKNPNLVCCHLALRGLFRLQALTESSFDGLHLGGNGLEGFLIVLLPLQSFVQTLLLLAYLCVERNEGKLNAPDLNFLLICGGRDDLRRILES